jgi:hypothetical protein
MLVWTDYALYCLQIFKSILCIDFLDGSKIHPFLMFSIHPLDDVATEKMMIIIPLHHEQLLYDENRLKIKI